MASGGECSAKKKRKTETVVGLNVGGTIYTTSSLTLLKNDGSFFSNMLKGGIPSKKDDKGNFFIDRDGQVFRHILNSMRYGQMVVPEDFKEYTLLESEADFYSLEELQKEAQKAVSLQAVTFAFNNHGKTGCSEMLFRVTKEAMSREDNSLFSKILSGEAAMSRDSQGNIVMERDGGLFKYVKIYLEKGALFSDLDVPTMESLEKEAVHFSLRLLQYQIGRIKLLRIYSIESSQVFDASLTPDLYLIMYWWVNGPCVVYANKWNIGELCKEDATICRGVFVGVIDKEKTMPAQGGNIDNIVTLIQQKLSFDHMSFQIEKNKMTDNCIVVTMNEFDTRTHSGFGRELFE